MEQNSRDNNNFRALDGGSEKDEIGRIKRTPDTYAEVLAGTRGQAMRSESSYDNTGLTGDQEELGLSGSAGMNTNAGPFGDKGMSDVSDAFSITGGIGLINHQILNQGDTANDFSGSKEGGKSR